MRSLQNEFESFAAKEVAARHFNNARYNRKEQDEQRFLQLFVAPYACCEAER